MSFDGAEIFIDDSIVKANVSSFIVDELRDDIKDVLAASDCRCEDGCIKDAHGHPVMVLVMDWIRIGNLNIDGG